MSELRIAATRKRWEIAAGVISWLASIIAPAISFDVELSLNSDSGARFQAYFLILSGVLFLLAWRSLDRLRPLMLGVLAMASLATFLTYSILRDEWTCAFYPHIYENRFTMGTDLRPAAAQALAEDPPADTSCQTLMDPFGGDAMLLWEPRGVVYRFLTLFGLYAFAWLSLAMLVFGAARYGLGRSGQRERV